MGPILIHYSKTHAANLSIYSRSFLCVVNSQLYAFLVGLRRRHSVLMESYQKVKLTLMWSVRQCVWETVYKFIHIKWNANRFTTSHTLDSRPLSSATIRHFGMWMKIEKRANPRKGKPNRMRCVETRDGFHALSGPCVPMWCVALRDEIAHSFSLFLCRYVSRKNAMEWNIKSAPQNDILCVDFVSFFVQLCAFCEFTCLVMCVFLVQFVVI